MDEDMGYESSLRGAPTSRTTARTARTARFDDQLPSARGSALSTPYVSNYSSPYRRGAPSGSRSRRASIISIVEQNQAALERAVESRSNLPSPLQTSRATTPHVRTYRASPSQIHRGGRDSRSSRLKGPRKTEAETEPLTPHKIHIDDDEIENTPRREPGADTLATQIEQDINRLFENEASHYPKGEAVMDGGTTTTSTHNNKGPKKTAPPAKIPVFTFDDGMPQDKFTVNKPLTGAAAQERDEDEEEDDNEESVVSSDDSNSDSEIESEGEEPPEEQMENGRRKRPPGIGGVNNNSKTKISANDIYSPMRIIRPTRGLLIYRLLFFGTIGVGIWYIYWMLFLARNDDAIVSYVFYICAEVLSFVGSIPFYFNMWGPKKRKWRSFDELVPPIPLPFWPRVDVAVCHYREPVDELMETVIALATLRYPKEKLHVYILDDGHFAQNMCNQPLSDVALSMLAALTEFTGVDYVLEVTDATREDCAIESHNYHFRAPDLPIITVVARVKPGNHHYKSGNVNNFLYNTTKEEERGEFLCVFDNDMRPVEEFILRTLPFFYNYAPSPSHIAQQGGITSDYVSNAVGFVQAPQRFVDLHKDDVLAASNTTFFDGIEPGRDGFGLVSFAGTNVMWRRSALDSVDGFSYGSLTEDILTGVTANKAGWVSVYAHEDLAFGTSPQTVAAAMLQRLRWAKGGIQIFLLNFDCIFCTRYSGNPLAGKEVGGIRSENFLPRAGNTFARWMILIDTTLYPFFNIASFCFIVVSLYYLFFNESPVKPSSTWELLWTFALYYAIRFAIFHIGYRDIKMRDVWRNQNTYWTFSFTQFMAMVQAVWERITGSSSSWFNTGEGCRRVWLEFYNIIVVFLLVMGVIFRTIAFFALGGGCHIWIDLAALLFGLFIITQMWPMVSMSIYERISSKPPEKRNNRGLGAPLALIAPFVILGGVFLLAVWSVVNCDKE